MRSALIGMPALRGWRATLRSAVKQTRVETHRLLKQRNLLLTLKLALKPIKSWRCGILLNREKFISSMKRMPDTDPSWRMSMRAILYLYQTAIK